MTDSGRAYLETTEFYLLWAAKQIVASQTDVATNRGNAG